MHVRTTKTGVVRLGGVEYWVVNSCVNRESLLYVIRRDNSPLPAAEESAERLAAISQRGWEIWWSGWCVCKTPRGRVEWRNRGRDDAVPTIAEIEARLSGEPDTDISSARQRPEYCVGGEWVPERECEWIEQHGDWPVDIHWPD